MGLCAEGLKVFGLQLLVTLCNKFSAAVILNLPQTSNDHVLHQEQ